MNKLIIPIVIRNWIGTQVGTNALSLLCEPTERLTPNTIFWPRIFYLAQTLGNCPN